MDSRQYRAKYTKENVLMGYIYIIKNNVNSKVYIGQTKKSIEERWKEHIYSSTYRNQILYMAMRKYGV